MFDLFVLVMLWWEFILCVVVVYVVVLGMVWLGGKWVLGQIMLFDVLLIVLLGNVVQNVLLGMDILLGGGLLLVVILILLNYGVGWFIIWNWCMEWLIEGEFIVIVCDGCLFEVVFCCELISCVDFDVVLCQQGGLQIEDVQIVLLEMIGYIIIIVWKGS